MTDNDPIKDPSEELDETPAELESSTAGEVSETVISAPKPKARPRKKPQAESEEKPAEIEPQETAPEPQVEEPEEQPVATLGSEPLSTPSAVPPGVPAAEPPVQSASPPPPYTPPPPQPLSDSEERTWAMLAHLSILLNLVTGFLGPVAALLVYLIYKDRSRYVRYHAMQSFVFQLIWWLGAGLLAGITWTISGVLAVILIGCLIMPIALFLTFIPLAALVYGVIGAIQANEHQDFRYWLIGDWVRGELTGD